jgi:hypothetical protein
VIACGGGPRTDDLPMGGSGGATHGSTDASADDSGPAPTTAHADTTSGTAADTGSSAGSSTGETAPPLPLCDEIAVSLVLDPQAPLYDDDSRAALFDHFDAIVAETGARVRIHAGVGVEQGFLHLCLQGDGPAVEGDDIIWGEDFVVHEDAAGALSCLMTTADPFQDPLHGDGDFMFSGLMFPILEREDWPPASADLFVAMLLAASDDDQDNMYGRPGMAAEAFLRLGGDGDRRRIAAFATGSEADELHTFTIALNDASAYFDWADHDLGSALQAWRPQLVTACAEHDIEPPPMPLGGCERIDVLFVIDGSLSMAEEQDALRGANGEPPILVDFVDALYAHLDTLDDVHIGVISSQPGDIVLHRSMDAPAVPDGPETDCGLAAGERWITAPDLDLATKFSCLGATQAAAFEEYTAENAAHALHHPTNAGFLRDDSVLLVVLLTDEDTQGFSYPRVEIHQDIMDAVGGDRSRVIVLGIAGDQGVFEMPKTTCYGPYGSASPGRRLTSIVSTFRDQGRTQDICEGDFAAIFAQALTDVVDVCENFHPEG